MFQSRKVFKPESAEMILWLSEYGMSPWEACYKIAEVGEIELSRITTPVVTTKILKTYL